ncbi:putative membrane protein [Natranaerovirga pectinivora]|uniref:Putative membrane protein n=1 Tax=Natranaerovirga pectinivora TaxID=682400 RepID=A0A4R3MJR2_9FIRM|nr:ECF transporter S component [Natranaerovirga pectinivora]TCT14296.1 putative membrane protein [Natranaerovirga pectinivora]
MNQSKSSQLAYTGLMTALVMISTAFISFTIPRGYIHLGDAMIFLCAILLKWKYGAFAAGVGSALADIYLGYTIWALPTLIVKSIMCIIAHFILRADKKSFAFVGVAIGSIWLALNVGFRYFLGKYVSEDPAAYLEALEYRGVERLADVIPYTNAIQNILIGIGLVFLVAVLLIVLKTNKSDKKLVLLRQFAAFSFAGMWMVIGYFITEIILYGNYVTPIFSVPFNVLQFVIGIILAQAIYKALEGKLPKELA